MILDTGLCTVYRTEDTAAPGAKPQDTEVAFHWSWYGELAFETAPARPTEPREEVRTDARIRILQHRGINNQCRVELTDAEGLRTSYRVTRAYHGVDAESGEQITDLNLEVYCP